MSGAQAPARTETVAVHTKTASAPATDPAAIRRAADQLAQAPGYTFKLAARLNVPGFGGAGSMSGDGSFSTAADAGEITADIDPPGVLGLLGEVDTQLLISGDDLYVLMPDGLDGGPIGGKPWGKATFAQLEAAAGVTGPDTLGGLLAALPHSAGAKVWLDPQGRIARVRYSYRGTKISHLTVTIAITGYGPQKAPAPPAPSVVGGLFAAAASLGL